MFTKINEETSRNYTKLYESGLNAMQKATQRQIDFAQSATQQMVKINTDIANQATTCYISAMTDINQMIREIVLRAVNIPSAS